MNIIKKINKMIVSKTVSLWYDIGRNPMEAIEFIVAFVLLMFGIYVMIPSEFLGVVNTTYGSDVVKFIFGLLISFAPARMVYWRLTGHVQDYKYIHHAKRRKMLLVVGGWWLYFMVLRIGLLGLLPPLWLTYFGFGLVTFICYVKITK